MAQRRGQTSVECYQEVKKAEQSTHTTSSCRIKAAAARVVCLEVVNSNARDVVVVRDDGNIATVLQDDAVSGGEFQLLEGSSPVRVLAAKCLTTQAAQSSVLKSRPDLVPNVPGHGIVVVAVYTSTTDSQDGSMGLHVGIWAFDTKKSTRNEAAIQPVVTHKLDCSNPKAAGRRFDFGSDARKLKIFDNLSTTTFDLTMVTPQQLSTVKHLMSDQTSEIELANNIYLLISLGKVQIYNAKYNSFLASTPLNKSMLKRKRDEPTSARLSALAYFSHLRRVVASDGTSILSIDIHAGDAVQNPFKQSSLLIGNILRGSQSSNVLSKPQNDLTYPIGELQAEKNPEHWSAFTRELDELVMKRDANSFEKRFLQLLKQDSVKSLTLLDVPRGVIDYLLSKIFQLHSVTSSDREDGARRLQVAFLAPELIKWLIRNGFLDEHHIFKATKANTAYAAVQSVRAVAQALLDADPELEIVQYYVQNSPIVEPAALGAIIKALLTRALAQSNEHMQTRFTHEPKMEADEAPSMQELVIGQGPDKMTVSTTTTVCLAHALKRLALAGPAVVSKQLRKSFDQQEVLALIQLLRQQLYLGGFTRLAGARKYPSPPSSAASDVDDHNMNPNPQICLEGIVLLLNGCVDALGPVGILGSEEHEEFIQNLLPDLLSEITSATQALEDSTFLQGLVRETLRYAESVERQPFEVRSKIQQDAARLSRKGEIVTLYAEADSEEAGVVSGSALPLSLKAEEDIASFKVRKGGGQAYKRSAREMGMLKDRLRSSYSFERLIL